MSVASGSWRLPCALVLLAALSSYESGAATAQPKQAGEALKAAEEKARDIEKATGATPVEARLPGGDPCTIVPIAQVRRVFPDVKGPERSRRLEKYGITECAWKGPQGQVLLGIQESYGDTDASARDEALGMAQGFTDPVKPESLRNARIEKFESLGMDNASFVESSEPARGILSDGAFMAITRDGHVVTLMSADLARRDRKDALQQLEGLGRTAAIRLK